MDTQHTFLPAVFVHKYWGSPYLHRYIASILKKGGAGHSKDMQYKLMWNKNWNFFVCVKLVIWYRTALNTAVNGRSVHCFHVAPWECHPTAVSRGRRGWSKMWSKAPSGGNNPSQQPSLTKSHLRTLDHADRGQTSAVQSSARDMCGKRLLKKNANAAHRMIHSLAVSFVCLCE